MPVSDYLDVSTLPHSQGLTHTLSLSESDEQEVERVLSQTNRYVTLIVCLSPATLGGEIVFPLVSNPLQEEDTRRHCDNESGEREEGVSDRGQCRDRHEMARAEELLERHGLSALFGPEKDMEKDLLVDCLARFAVPLQHLHTLVVYNQDADGLPQPLSMRGTCPVLEVTDLIE
jgi:hypothetical protein